MSYKNEHFLKQRYPEKISKKSNFLVEGPVCLFVMFHTSQLSGEGAKRDNEKTPNLPTLTVKRLLDRLAKDRLWPSDDDDDNT